MLKRIVKFVTGLVYVLVLGGITHAQGQGTWRLDAIYSSADGAVQFIVLRQLDVSFAGGLAGRTLEAGDQMAVRTFVFPDDAPAARAHGKFTVLIGTRGFADLNVVKPDFIVPNGFLTRPRGWIWFAGGCSHAYDSLPTDGAMALYLRDCSLQDELPNFISVARATNFAGQSVLLGDSANGIARWVATGKLIIPRHDHTATLLPSGKVLVAGGRDGDYTHDSAELYDPAIGTWSVTGRMNTARAGHTATLLPNGKVLVVGGENIPNILDVAELYDPETGVWTRASAPATPRFDHTATLLQTGNVLVAGGAYAGFVGIVELYDPTTNTWSTTGSLETRRASHQATLLLDGRVLVTGGMNESDKGFPLGTTELYDPAAGTWSRAATLNVSRRSHTATLLPDGNVMVAGGYGPPIQLSPNKYRLAPEHSAEIYDPATARWNHVGSLHSHSSGRTATLLPDGNVLVVGNVPSDPGHYPIGAELYDSRRADWRAIATTDMRVGHTATRLQNGMVLVAGGFGGATLLTHNSVELYDSGASGPTIGAGHTGSWFNPAQNGHGFALEVLPGSPMHLLASWFTFAPQGGPAWIIGLGPINGSRAQLQGYQSVGSGGRFPPNFDAANVRQEFWGDLTFTFRDCDHGRVEWMSVVPGYGSGGMDLTRLTLPAGLTCQ